mgnify:CR=1 FL=1
MHDNEPTQDVMSVKTQNIVYIGKKKFKRDTVGKSGTVWAGYGDVQEVPHSAATKMRLHPDVWVTEKEFKAQKTNGAGLSQANTVDPEPESEASIGKKDIVKTAILSLEPANMQHFSDKTGNPLVNAVKTAIGDDTIQVTANDVKAAWAEIQQE